MGDGGGRAESAVAGRGSVWTTLPTGVIALDSVSGNVRAKIVTGSYGRVIGADAGTVWIVEPHRLVVADLMKRRVRMRIALPREVFAGTVAYGAVWLPSFVTSTLTRMDARTGDRQWESKLPRSPQAVTATHGSVWVASVGPWHKGPGGVMVPEGPGIVSRLDPSDGRPLARIDVGKGPSALAAGIGAVWVLNGSGIRASDTVDRIDARSNRVLASIRVPHWSSDVACGSRYCWVVGAPRSAGGVVTRIDPRRSRVVTRAIPRSWIPAAVVVVKGRVWIADPGVAQLISIDTRTLRVIDRVKLPIT